MLPGLPLAVTAELHPGAVDKQAQRPASAAIRDLHTDPRLASAQRRIVRHRPVEPSHPDQALDQPNRLPQRKAEEHFQRESGLDRGFRERLGRSPLAGLSGVPDRVGIKPARQRATASQRCIVSGPVCCAIAGGSGLRHSTDLKHWIREVNPHH